MITDPFPRGRGRRRAAATNERRTTETQRRAIAAWFAGRLPPEWTALPHAVEVDDDEILVVISLPEVTLDGDVTDEERRIATSARVDGWREATRAARVHIAEDAQQEFDRTVSWGARCGDERILFTTASVPVMTRLRIGERAVLDTLITAGVARSRSEALAWCVRLVEKHEEEWIADLRAAFAAVEAVRNRGPRSAS